MTTATRPETRKWISNCRHAKRIVVGSMEYEDAEQHGWSYCNRNGCKDTIAGHWDGDKPRKGNTAMTAKKPAATKPAAKPAGKPTASKARKPADSLPNRVRAAREAADLSPKELAAKIGGDWTASTVRRIERGARKASIQQIAELAGALNVPVAGLGFTTATVEQPLPKVDATDRKAAKPAKVVAVGKRTGKAIATTQDVKDEVAAILGA